MKLAGKGARSGPEKVASQVAVASALLENTPGTVRPKAPGVPDTKVVTEKSAKGSRPQHHTSGLASFTESGVKAHDAVVKGVSGRPLARIWESTRGTLPPDAILRAIGVSARTAHRISSDPDKPLDARTTDGIYRLESVRALAEEVLGSPAAANEWLNSEAMGLEFRKPIDLVSTSPGAEAVKTLLQRMNYGGHTPAGSPNPDLS